MSFLPLMNPCLMKALILMILFRENTISLRGSMRVRVAIRWFRSSKRSFVNPCVVIPPPREELLHKEGLLNRGGHIPLIKEGHTTPNRVGHTPRNRVVQTLPQTLQRKINLTSMLFQKDLSSHALSPPLPQGEGVCPPLIIEKDLMLLLLQSPKAALVATTMLGARLTHSGVITWVW